MCWRNENDVSAECSTTTLNPNPIVPLAVYRSITHHSVRVYLRALLLTSFSYRVGVQLLDFTCSKEFSPLWLQRVGSPRRRSMCRFYLPAGLGRVCPIPSP